MRLLCCVCIWIGSRLVEIIFVIVFWLFIEVWRMMILVKGCRMMVVIEIMRVVFMMCRVVCYCSECMKWVSSSMIVNLIVRIGSLWIS